MNRIGVLTSGADAPGMNAAIRSVVRTGLFHNIEMVGIQYGFYGLMNGFMKDMDADSVGSIIQRGGTILQSSVSEEILTDEGQNQAIANLKRSEIDGLIVIGGKDVLKVVAGLAGKNFPTMAVPATIYNDIPGVEETIGFDTALNTVIDHIDRIRDTAFSHEKTSIIEVMGKDTGQLALWSGVAGGAESILIPEKKEEIETIIEQMKSGSGRRDKRYSIIVMTEGVGNGIDLSEKLKEEAGIESRVTVLGHTQRGGTPSARDRVVASRLGCYAVELLLDQDSGSLVGLENNRLVHYEFQALLSRTFEIDDRLYDLAKELTL
ncbi:6-phosphofructokinase [Halobacillus locisalis]|uniref:6-phosphofructokinase n=1 Tax=Halobacillus locisalis TaxID=220753 RepID=A0A838CVN3_9BACI|nr:ATP-dependent 6-phosphofructokinase [Halobacillus locisalis]MBA2175889.1 6-phosphofructokinase [Halobacillus locisalis]